ncbi:hypothetical protein BV22DRAFT_773205 [Leucogyrophana mollusca]|uniref:Uncharacterized protein n=1 Tax=Leucogyrophana mollusca TaxID=85980 RepID=A0ACB8B6N7_9AGAM|nr:hypothetical protein BV22DRAFT_773205 [Leucogyrophana mollusca]
MRRERPIRTPGHLGSVKVDTHSARWQRARTSPKGRYQEHSLPYDTQLRHLTWVTGCHPHTESVCATGLRWAVKSSEVYHDNPTRLVHLCENGGCDLRVVRRETPPHRLNQIWPGACLSLFYDAVMGGRREGDMALGSSRRHAGSGDVDKV